MALVMIGFLLGGHLTRAALRERGRQVIVLSSVVVVVTFLAVGLGLYALGVPAPVALLLAAISTATAPAATLDVVHETHRETPFSRELVAIVAVDDLWGLIAFSVALALGLFAVGGDAQNALLHGLWELGGALALGLALGIPMAYLTGRIEPGEPSLYEALGLVFLCGGLALWLGVSFLLAAVTLGATVANLARHHARPFHAIEGIEWPFMVLFFVLAGASLDVGVLVETGSWLVGYVVLRVFGRLAGAWIGGWIPPADVQVRRFMGMALLPQAGIALGMALVAAERLPELGEVIISIVVAATILFELVGPMATRVALEITADGDG
jgi:Kef-type K+ transport system membrane component KefB